MSGKTPLVLASGNPGKLREFSHFFQSLPTTVAHWSLLPKPADVEAKETGVTFESNAQEKACSVALATGSWAIADDSGLAVEALNGAPGVFSARYAQTDAARIARVVEELKMTGSSNRAAAFMCAIALCDPHGQTQALAQGICPGEILEAPRGQGGFGYDPIFYVPSLGLTFAEMTPDQKQQVGHRGLALLQLQDQLSRLGS